MRLKIIGNEIIKPVCKSESCMVSKLPIIFKRTRIYRKRVCDVRPCGSRTDLTTVLDQVRTDPLRSLRDSTPLLAGLHQAYPHQINKRLRYNRSIAACLQ